MRLFPARLDRFVLAVALNSIVAGTASAAPATWDGNGSVNGNWMNGANWAGDVAPVPGRDDLHFAGAINTTTNNDFAAGAQFNGITFDAGANPFVLNGNAIVLGGGVINSSASAQTANLPMALGGLSATAISGASAITTGASNLTLNNISRPTLSGQAAVFTTGGGTIKTSFANDASGILGAWATIGSNWAAADGSGNIVPYAGYNEVTGAPTIANPATPTSANVRWGASSGNATTGAGTTDINSLVYTDVVNRTLTIASGNTLRLGASGGIFKTDSTVNQILTVGSAGSFLTAGGAADTAGELILNANSITPDINGIVVASALNNNGTGAVTVVKTGSASAQLNVANTYSGGSYIHSGRLRANNAAAYGTGPVFVASGAQSYLNSGTVNNNFFLAGKAFEEGATPFNGGAMRLAANGVTATGTITLLSDTRISARGANAAGAVISGQITGNAGWDFSGAATGANTIGKVTLSNSTNNWTGNLTVFNGALIVGGTGEVIPNGAGRGNVTINGDSTLDGTNSILDINGKTETINGLFSAGNVAKVFVQSGVTGGAAVSTPATLIVGDNNTSSTFGGTIQTGTSTSTMGLTKVGTGTLTLTGTNTYTGATAVNGGTLLINGAHTGAGSYTIGAGATLGGTGNIALGTGAGLTVSAGGTLAPGASIGTQILNGAGTSAAVLALNSGAFLNFELNNPLASDRISLVSGAAGDISFGGNVINFSDLSGGTLTPGQYVLFSSDVPGGGAYSGLTVSPQNAITGGLTLGTGLSAYPGARLELASGAAANSDIVLTLVPEPASALLGVFGLVALTAVCRSRRRRS